MAGNRNYDNWLDAFMKYAAIGEAPDYVYLWVGVATIAGALRRKVWIDQVSFKWFPNQYIILVAPPGEISKTTTTGIGMSLLKKVEGVHFGPNVVTWQALVSHYSNCNECFTTEDGEAFEMQPLTIHSGELGNLLNPNDREMIDMMTTLWDGGSVHKLTKGSGEDNIESPILNFIGCTTPSWINSSIPEYFLGGGFLSRCLFVHAAEKARLVPYVSMNVPPDHHLTAAKLVADLGIMTEMAGDMMMTKGAIDFGIEWYAKMKEELKNAPPVMLNFIARKQSHVHKLALILSAARSNDMVITEDDMRTAVAKLDELQPYMQQVLDSIGKSHDARNSDEIVDFIKRAGGKVSEKEFQSFVAKKYPRDDLRTAIINGLTTAGKIAPEGMMSSRVWRAA